MSTETGVSLPITEQDNPRSENLSSSSTIEIVRLMNAEDATVAAAVESVLGEVAKAVDGIVDRRELRGQIIKLLNFMMNPEIHGESDIERARRRAASRS